MRRASSGGTRIFVDSSAYYAAAVSRDENHLAAVSILSQLEREAARLFTTRYILAETHALVVARRRNAREALQLLTRIEASRSTTVIATSEDDERRGRIILSQYQDHLFSLADALSFAVMERFDIRHSFTFDDDFGEYGFTVLNR